MVTKMAVSASVALLGMLLVFGACARPGSIPAVQPARPISSVMPTVLDSTSTEPRQWEYAAYVGDTQGEPAPETIGDILKALYYGYDTENLWLRFDTGISVDSLKAETCRISVYFSGKNDLEGQALTERYSHGTGYDFGFGIASKLEIAFGDQNMVAIFSVPDGQGGWKRQATLPFESGERVEIAVPFSLLELGPGDDLRFAVIGYCQAAQEDLIPDTGFLELRIPLTFGAARIASFADPADDDHGPGGYVYPSDPVFTPGAFDVTSLEVAIDADQNMIFKIGVVGDLSAPWGGLTGYSLQAIDLYIDTDGIADSGERSLFKGRKAMTVPEHAWEYFVRASMDTVAIYGRGGRRLDTVKVVSYADRAASSIFITFPRAAIAPLGLGETGRWHVIAAMLGHDGYSAGGVRPVKTVWDQWAFGGCDAEDLCPNIIDLVVDRGRTQEEILSAYEITGRPVEIPGIEIVLP